MKTISSILEAVSSDLDIDLLATASSRKRRYIYARSVYYKISRELTMASLADIGAPLGKNYATVLHSLESVFPQVELYEVDMMRSYRTCKERSLHEIKMMEEGTSKKASSMISALRMENKTLRAEVESLSLKVENLKVAADPIIADFVGRVSENNRQLFIDRLDAMTKMLAR